MLKNEREQEILNVLQSTGYATVKFLSEQLYTSESCVRRALTGLTEKGLVRRSYGGVELLSSHTNVTSFGARAHQNAVAKQAIAKKAAPLVEDGSIVFLDGSSTSFYLAAQLLSKTGLTVVTNNTEILNLLAQANFKVYCSGGELSETNRTCLVGPDAQRSFAGIYAQYAFFSSNALSAEGVITDCTREEVAVRETILQNARKKIFLCDSSKFNTVSVYRQCDLGQIDTLVSEDDRAKEFAVAFPNLKVL